MLMPILKELFLWLYGLFLDLIAFCANSLLGIMSTDLSYFEKNVPAVKTMYSVFIAVGWALLLGNMVFQAMKSMCTGLGFEGEDPATLLARTGIFGFLLIFSRQICDIGMGISKKVIELLGIPAHIDLKLPEEGFFSGFDSSWVLVIIIGLLLGIQLVKLFFEIGERYVIIAVLTLFAPVGFAMGGSKSTKDIFTGYIRMYASMLLMMVMNVVFLKLILSAMSVMPTGIAILPWGILVVGLARAARKIDNMIGRIGLNPAITGDPISRGGIGAATMLAARAAISSVSRAGQSFRSSNRSTANLSGQRGSPKTPTGGMGRPYQPQSQAAMGQPNTDRFGMAAQTANTNMQNQQNSRFGSSISAHSGSVHAAQSASFRSNAYAGGSNGVSYNRFSTNSVNGGSSDSRSVTQQTLPANHMNASRSSAGSPSAKPNVKQAQKTQPAQAAAPKFGQTPKGNAPLKSSKIKTNTNPMAGAPSLSERIKMTPNFRKPPIPQTGKPVQQPEPKQEKTENRQPEQQDGEKPNE